MKKLFICAALATICATAAYGDDHDHRHGDNNKCWYEKNYGNKSKSNNWAYYFCGQQNSKCDGKSSKGHDIVFWQYHGDSFTFKYAPKDTHWCCDGTKDSAGQYVKSDKWIVKTVTTRIATEGGTCNKLIQTDACGGVHEVECTEPDSCNAGLILRNGVCIKPCADGEIFASPDSNTCINCETTPYQGIVIKTEKKKVGLLKKREKEIQYETCLKCDKDTQFFNRQTKQCVPKENFSAVSMESIRACWMCPGDMQKDCVMEMGKPESERGFAINNWGEIKRRCHIE